MMQAFPKEWKICKITDLISPDKNAIKVGPFGSQIKKDEMWSSGYKVYGQENVILNNFNIGDRFVDAKKFLELRTSQLFSGDVVITMMGTGGQCRVVPDNIAEGIMDSHLMRIQCNNKIENFFLARLLQDFDEVKQQVFRKSQGSIMEGLSAKVIKSLALPVPPKIEQQKIATILSTLDRTIKATQKLIDKEKMVKKGLMADLLTHGIDEQGRIRSPQTHTYVDGIPEEWESKRICELADVIGGGTPSRDVEEFWKNGTIYWATPTDITKEKTGKYIHETKECISEIGLSSSSAKLLPSNSILLTSRATIGEMRINSKPMATNQGFTPILPFDNVEFLYYLLHMYVLNMRRRAYGTTFPEISRTEVKNIFVSLPKSPKEQQNIATILSAQDRKIETEESNLAKLQNLKKGLMGDLLSGKVRVKND